MTREVWPNFFIVGAPSCRATSLYERLKPPPGVYTVPVDESGHFTNVGHFAVVP